ncbi:ABC transporter permease [Geobacter sp. SVR]|uniref:ABC transporter permease n=1 Tax=Geobacter sp. SVR TaxID=2495594 RepID=UPI00143EFB6A|nr:ABC transporter permease [Geobacter sp. SVR]BCS52111.1 ABC transporter permease [Geobacter sp. SVR]GCF86566.1 ABC transporter permease [Geobacter sp. SVR]
MNKRRWLVHIVARALAHRKGRTILLLAVLTMASSLATALGIVSSSMGKRVAEEVRKYGANLVIVPEMARLNVGSGGLNFGEISEPEYLEQHKVENALAKSGLKAGRSFHLRGALHFRKGDVMVEGINFADIRQLFPWWQIRGQWPTVGEAVVGHDVADRYGMKTGETVELTGPEQTVRLRISGIVSTGGEEDDLLFLALPELQRVLGLEDRLTSVRLLVTAEGDSHSLGSRAAALQSLYSGARVTEVRQIARTSEGLLVKVKLLMLLVTAVVLISAGSSVTGTMSTTVLERSKEIGLMKAMGGTRWGVMLIFCSEAAMLGILGGIAGYFFGSVIAQFITRTVFSAPAEFAPWFAGISLLVSLFLALLGSLGPMVSVFRLDPVRSLRGE